MFESKNIIVTNGVTHFKLKQDSKIVFFNSNTLTKFTKVSYKFMRSDKKLHLLN